MALITMGALITGGILGPGTGQAATVTVDQKDFFFDPTTVTVDGGDTLTIANVSKTSPHTFTISDQGIDVVNNPGQTQSITINLSPGS